LRHGVITVAVESRVPFNVGASEVRKTLGRNHEQVFRDNNRWLYRSNVVVIDERLDLLRVSTRLDRERGCGVSQVVEPQRSVSGRMESDAEPPVPPSHQDHGTYLPISACGL
jgi:hypothetical protein